MPPPGAGNAPSSTGSPLPGGWRGSARSLLCFCGGEFPAAGSSEQVSKLENQIGQNQGRKLKIRASKVPRRHLGSGGDRAPGCWVLGCFLGKRRDAFLWPRSPAGSAAQEHQNSLAQDFAHQFGFLTGFSGGKSDLVFVFPQEMIPFAVVGSDQEYQVNGRRILGRKTKWGTIEGSLPLFPLLPS